MSEKEYNRITKGNKLIADYVGLKIRYTQSAGWNGEQGDWDMEIDCPDFFDHDEQLMFLYDEGEPETCFKFHSSWDWLMPVVQQLEKETNKSILLEAAFPITIESVFSQVLKFIRKQS